MKLQKSYLCAYNMLQLYLWTQVVFQFILTCFASTFHKEHLSISLLYHSMILPARWGQTLAWLEVLHAAIGLAGSGISTAFIQSLARYVILIKVIEPIPATHSSPVTLILLLVWAIADVIRYTFYIYSAISPPPYVFLWLRYSIFIPLYPIGILSEWLTYLQTLRHIDKTHLYSVTLPNPWNFAFDFGIWNRFVLLIYLYFGPFMYKHMLRQRRKKIP